MPMFRSLLPEKPTIGRRRHGGHPGCFATGMLLAAMPLMRPQARGRPAGRSRSALVDPRLMVSAVTGSTGAGRAPRPTTHHPTRHANMFAYKPLAHRHVPEVEGILRASSGRGGLSPSARGGRCRCCSVLSATEAGRPNAARAAGQAMAKNPLALVIPCHRVIGSNGDLHGYGAGGLSVKARLLQMELGNPDLQ